MIGHESVRPGFTPSLLNDLPIRTERLILRLPEPSDEVSLTPIRNQPRVLAALNKNAITVQRMRENLNQVATEALANDAFSAVVEIAKSSAVIGMVRLERALPDPKTYLTVWVGNDQPERHCGREAARAMVALGFEHLPVAAILAEVFGANQASFSMLDNLGFVETDAEERATHLGPRLVTKYSLSREAWAATTCPKR